VLPSMLPRDEDGDSVRTGDVSVDTEGRLAPARTDAASAGAGSAAPSAEKWTPGEIEDSIRQLQRLQAQFWGVKAQGFRIPRNRRKPLCSALARWLHTPEYTRLRGAHDRTIEQRRDDHVAAARDAMRAGQEFVRGRNIIVAAGGPPHDLAADTAGLEAARGALLAAAAAAGTGGGRGAAPAARIGHDAAAGTGGGWEVVGSRAAAAEHGGGWELVGSHRGGQLRHTHDSGGGRGGHDDGDFGGDAGPLDDAFEYDTDEVSDYTSEGAGSGDEKEAESDAGSSRRGGSGAGARREAAAADVAQEELSAELADLRAYGYGVPENSEAEGRGRAPASAGAGAGAAAAAAAVGALSATLAGTHLHGGSGGFARGGPPQPLYRYDGDGEGAEAATGVWRDAHDDPAYHSDTDLHSGGQPPLRDAAEFGAVEDLWSLSITNRRAWHDYCLRTVRAVGKRLFDALSPRYNKVSAATAKLQAHTDAALLREMAVVGFTTTGAAKNRALLQALSPDILVVEEAAEVLEGHILACLTPRLKQLILIGDHQQLRPKVNTHALVRRHNLDMSLFERLINRGRGVPHQVLLHQHRMRPEIARLLCPLIYPVLHNHPVVEGRPHVKGVAYDVFLLDHGEPERTSGIDTKSKYNPHEVELCCGLVRYLLLNGYRAEQVRADVQRERGGSGRAPAWFVPVLLRRGASPVVAVLLLRSSFCLFGACRLVTARLSLSGSPLSRRC